ncbi:MAG: sulfate adenylyltransferase [Desulfobacterales bacterium]|nr:sulfate adenylyltransferase [Desulfobacterales bacterium]
MALVKPHGSKKELTPRLVTGTAGEEAKKKAVKMARVQISAREAGDLMMLGMGAFAPLTGFMGRADYEGVLEEMRLRGSDPGVLWPLPVTLAVEAPSFKEGEEIALFEQDSLLATMVVEEIFEPDKKRECESVFVGQGTKSVDEFWRIAMEEHPGVRQVMASGRYYAGGPVRVLSEKNFRRTFGNAYMHPAVARSIFEDLGWSEVAVFQTRNPMHRPQEYICKVAQEVSDGLLIHAVVGAPAPDEVPADVRFACCQALVSSYFNRERTVLAVSPLEMRFAGPREALLHAIFRQNFGCSHLLVGRDHAGVGDFYGLFEAQTIFDRLWPGALEIQPLKIDWAFWSKRNKGMASLKTCPVDDPADRVLISGSKLRQLLRQGKTSEVPEEFSRPEVLRVLAEYYSRPKP